MRNTTQRKVREPIATYASNAFIFGISAERLRIC